MKDIESHLRILNWGYVYLHTDWFERRTKMILPLKFQLNNSFKDIELIVKMFCQGKLVEIAVSPPPDTKINPLQVYRNTWYDGLKDGFVIPLSCDRGIWTVVFSYKAMGCQIMKWDEEEILRCQYLGYIPELLKIPIKNFE